ncbi:TPA: hypothetical protein ACMDQU_004444 [Vibrio parahaemolyticus]
MAAPCGNQNNNKYQPDYATQVYKLCLMGARDQDLAEFFEVHRDTIFHWVSLYPEFAEARKRGKLAADAEVAYSLFNRAMGFWLKCRSRDNWNPNQQVELSGSQANPLAFILADIAKESEEASPLPTID